MNRLADPAVAAEILARHGFRFRKRFGQNFLIDANILGKIIRESGVEAGDFVLEVGPGIGTLTQALAEQGAVVAAVEIDRDLVGILRETMADYPSVTVIEGDILKTDIGGIVRTYGAGRPFRVVANLPYYITTPVLMELFSCGEEMKSAAVMVQKEVADRILAQPGTEDYGALTLALAYRARARICASVPPSCFMPRPGVGSAVCILESYGSDRPVQPKDEALMFRLIRAAFGQRRKTLLNSLEHGAELGLEKEKIREVLAKAGVDPSARGETLGLAQFAELSDCFFEELNGRL